MHLDNQQIQKIKQSIAEREFLEEMARKERYVSHVLHEGSVHVLERRGDQIATVAIQHNLTKYWDQQLSSYLDELLEQQFQKKKTNVEIGPSYLETVDGKVLEIVDADT